MKKILIAYCLIFSISALAQQESMYNHYMFNTQLFNPGYIGSTQAYSLNILQRNQWVGFDGAPVSQALSFCTPVQSKRLAYGLTAINDKIGPIINNSFAADLAYHLVLNGNDNILSLGMKFSLNSYNVDTDDLNLNQINDPMFNNESTGLRPNIGSGVYYYTPKFYLGLSVPYFLQDKLLGQKRHFYLTSGILVNLTRDIQLRPSALVKMTRGVPINMDISNLFIFRDQFWLGANLRSTYKNLSPSEETGGGFGGIFGLNISENIMVSYAYSYSLGNKTGLYNDGTHEIILRLKLFNKEKALIDSPRYF